MDESSTSVPAMIGIIGAILTVIIKTFEALSAWKEGRDEDNRAIKEIRHAQQEVEFINVWLDAVNKTSNDQQHSERTDEALSRLDRLMSKSSCLLWRGYQTCDDSKAAQEQQVDLRHKCFSCPGHTRHVHR